MHNGHGPRPPSGRQPGISTSNNRTGTNSQSGQGGGPPGIGDTGPSQAAIESAKSANQQRAWSQPDPTGGGDPEKGDYWVPPTEPYKSPTGGVDYADKMALSKQSSDLALALNKAGINTDQLQRYIKAGIIPENVAQAAGWVKPGEHWDPTAQFGEFTTEERFKELGDFQTAREEGGYGGVSGNEAVVNQTKNEILDAQNRLDNATTQADWDEANEDYNTALNDLDKIMGGGDATKGQAITDQIFNAKTGQFKEGFGADPFTGTFADMSFRDIEETAGRYTGRDEEGNLLKSGWQPNLDPETNIYQKYLNIGGNPWDDPMSGILKPTGKINYGGYGGGGGGGWRDYGGGGGGGGGGWMLPSPGMSPEQKAGFFTPQANLQQAMVNVHQTPTGFQPGYNRGGIVSLLGLRS